MSCIAFISLLVNIRLIVSASDKLISHHVRTFATPLHSPFTSPCPIRFLTGVVLGRLEWWSFGCSVAPSHATVNDEISAVDEAALIAGEKEHSLSLLDSLAETTRGEVHFAAMALRLVVTEPVLQERGAAMISMS